MAITREEILAASVANNSYTSTFDFNAQMEDQDLGDALTKGLAASVVSGGVGIVNTGIAVGNMFGADIEQIKTEELLRTWDWNDTYDYYQNNKEIIDGVGFAVSALVPGTLGLKAAKYAQAAAKASQSKNLLAVGLRKVLVPENVTAKIQGQIVKDAAHIANRSTFTMQAAKSGVHQAAVESFFAETAILLTTNQHVTVNNNQLGYFEAMWEQKDGFLLGMGLGTGIGGLVQGAVNARAVGSLVDAAEKKTNVLFKAMQNLDSRNNRVGFVQGNKVVELSTRYKEAVEKFASLEGAELAEFTRREKELFEDLVEEVAVLTGEASKKKTAVGRREVSGNMTQALMDLIQKGKAEEVADTFRGASSIGRYDDQDFLFDPVAQPVSVQDNVADYVDAVGFAESGQAYTVAKAIEPAKRTPAQKKIIASAEEVARARGVSVYDPTNARIRQQFINKEIIEQAGDVSPLDPRHLIGTIRHEVGHGNTVFQNAMFQAKGFSAFKGEMEALSRLHRPSSWVTVDNNRKVLEALQAKSAGGTKLSTSELQQMNRIQQWEDYMNNPLELMADSWAMYNARDPKLRAMADELAPLTRKVMENNATLKTRLGKSEKLIGLKSGKLYDESQWSPTMADRGKPVLKGGVVTAGQQGYKIDEKSFSVLTASPDEASAHYFAAFENKTRLGKEVVTSWDNFYQLNRLQKALDENSWGGTIKITMPDESVKVLDIDATVDFHKEFTDTYRELKGHAATKLNQRELNKRNNTYANIGRIIDTDEDFAIGLGQDPSAIAYWTREHNPNEPTVAKVFYQAATDENGMQANAVADAISQNNKILEVNDEAINSFFGEVDRLTGTSATQSVLNTVAPEPSWKVQSGTDMTDVTAHSQLTGTFKTFHGQYGESTSKLQAIGKFNEMAKLKGNEHLQSLMANVSQRVTSDPAAIMELNVLDSRLRQQFFKFAPTIQNTEQATQYLMRQVDRVTPEQGAINIQKLLSSETGQNLVSRLKDGKLIWTRDLENAVAKIVNQKNFMQVNLRRVDSMLEDGIVSIKNQSVYDFWRAKVAANVNTVNGKRTAAGARGYGSNLDDGTLYPGGINPTKYKHRKYIVPVNEEVWSHNQKGIIGASSPSELAQKEAQVRQQFGGKVRIVSKEEMEANFKRTGEFLEDYSLNEYQVNRDLSRKGVNWDVAPEANPDLVAHYIRDMSKDWAATVDNLTELKYAEEFAALQQLDGVSQSFGTLGAGRQEIVDTPFREAQAIMLNRTATESSKTWKDAQAQVDKLLTKVYGGLRSAFTNAQKGSGSYEDMDAYMEHYGLPRVYEGLAGDVLRTSTGATDQALKELVPKMNGIAATMMLRLDYIQPMINALSMPIMSVPEMDALFKAIPAVRAQQVAKGLHVKVPNTKFSMGTNMKLQMQAVKDFWSPEGKALLERYHNEGIITNIAREMRQAASDITIDASFTATSMAAKVSNAASKVVNVAAKPADFAEDFVKFVAARQAELVMDAAGITDASIRRATVRTYTTRVHGNYVHSQRPSVFQGFAGQAIGLFQTYQFNLIQSLLGKIGDKNGRQVAAMMGIQAGMFGVQSVPGFKALNSYVAQNSDEDADFYSIAGDVAGNEESEWLLYGLSSNFTKPVFGEGLELYTRGDLNPRTPFILPTSLEEVPAWALSTKFVGNILNAAEDISQGAGAGQVFANALAHNGVNRPLAGVGALLAGTRTTNQGSLIANLSDLSWFGRAARTLGTKTLDESIAVQSFYRTKAYDTKRQDSIQELGRAAKISIQGSDGAGFSNEQYNGFMESYTSSGGSPEKFNQWVHNQALGAEESTILKMYESNNSKSGRYLQNVMGYDIDSYIDPNL